MTYCSIDPDKAAYKMSKGEMICKGEAQVRTVVGYVLTLLHLAILNEVAFWWEPGTPRTVQLHFWNGHELLDTQDLTDMGLLALAGLVVTWMIALPLQFLVAKPTAANTAIAKQP
ncbi:expressed unknown protein [Seminavis robusta]|uniref:Uncharacterized protein n=1 Tax=Seminavis robusta TaxID=568900 RepID=A0A9N8DZ69_9STRA|nr:expressed unknown protein [Seminavis robusta]|eukprot:Sro493_g154040.1 n/a (115) ;mRNA; r:20905-21603